MVKKWVHINFMGGDPWVLKIWGAFNSAKDRGKIPGKTVEMAELSLHISKRLNIIPWVVRKINEDLKSIHEAAKSINETNISTAENQGYAFDINNKTIYSLLSNFDSFIFEIDSCCELITTFARVIYNHCGDSVDKKQVGKRLKAVIEGAGGNSTWFESLQSLRNYFIHEGAPFFAIDVTDPDNYDLLVMKENLKSFDDDTKYIRLRAEFKDILEGFYDGNRIIQEHLITFLSS